MVYIYVYRDKCEVVPLLEVEDMILMGNRPEWKCVFIYILSFYRKFELEPRARQAALINRSANANSAQASDKS